VVKEGIVIRSTRNRTTVITRDVADYQFVKPHFDTNNLSYYSFYPKSEKPMKTVIRHLPHNTPVEDTSDGLAAFGFDVKHMTATRRLPSDGSTTINLPLFPNNLARTVKSQEIFRLRSFCHIRIKASRAQSGLTQCLDCQQFGHVWANCMQTSCCLWCGGGHLHKELERRKTKLENTEIKIQAIRTIKKSLLKRDGPKAPTAIHGLSGLKLYPSEKANATADCLDN
jgi:hypothetical protein